MAYTPPTTRATSTLITASIWNTDLVDNISFLYGFSRVRQVVHTQSSAVATGTTTMPIDDTIPQNTEGTEFITLAITPTDATNKLLIDAVFTGAFNGGAMIAVALFQDTTANALAAVAGQGAAADSITTIILRHEMTAGTTSATTFKIRAGSNSAGTLTFNGRSGGRIFGGVIASSIRITEFRP